MCLQKRSKKYTYLSMCSCCNMVSKYPLTVKKHINSVHSHLTEKAGKKVAIWPIPIRIEHAYLKIIKRLLDNKKLNNTIAPRSEHFASSNDSAVRNENVKKLLIQENFSTGNSILCTICKKKFEGFVSYFMHMSAQDHNNVKMCFKCTECSCLFPSITSLLNHNKIHTDKNNLDMFSLDCVSATDSNINITQCPYCVSLFDSIGQMYLHIGDKHSTCLEITTIKVDSAENPEENNLLSYRCKYCKESLHALTDFVRHISDKHPSHFVQPVRLSRKRKLPKWLSESNYEEKVTKSKARKVDQADVHQSSVVKSKKHKKGKGKQQSVAVPVVTGSEKETIHEKIKIGSTLSAVVMLKRCDDCNEIQERPNGHTENMVATSGDGRVKKESPMKIAKSVRHDILEKRTSIIGSEKKDEIKFHKTNIGLLADRKADKNERVSNDTHDKKQHVTKLPIDRQDGEVNEEDLAGDSDDDFVDEMKTDECDVEQEHDATHRELIYEHCNLAEFTHKDSLERHIEMKHSGLDAMLISDSTVSVQLKENDVTFIPEMRQEENDSFAGGEMTIIGVGETENFISGVKFKCPFCDFYLYHREYVFTHIQKFHTEVEHFTAGDIVREAIMLKQAEVNREIFQCQSCDFTSKWKKALRHHMRNKHSDKFPTKDIPCILQDFYSEKEALSVKLKCPNCEITVEGKDAFKRHIEEHTSEQPITVVYRISLNVPKVINKPCKKLDSYICPYCEGVFTQRGTLRSHKCTENLGSEKSMPVIKCVLVKPTTALETKTLHSRKQLITNSGDSFSSKHNEDTQYTSKSKLDNDKEYCTGESVLRNGTYVCPVCNSFTTSVKAKAVAHILDNHFNNRIHDVDLLFIFEAFLDRKEANVATDQDNVFVGCKSCAFSADNLTDILRHSKTHETGSESIEETNDQIESQRENRAENSSESPHLGCSKGVSLFGTKSSPGLRSETVKNRSVQVKENDILANYKAIKMNNEGIGCVEKYQVFTVTKFKCPFCAFTLYHKEYIYSHIQRFHPEVEYFTSSDVFKETLDLKENEMNREYLKCPECSFTSKWKNQIFHHFVHDHSTLTLGNVSCILPMADNHQRDSAGHFVCSICKARFTGKDALENHMMDNLSRKSGTYQCKNCLPEPEALAYSSKKLVSWLCPYCDLVFTRKDSLRSHLTHHLDTSLHKFPVIKCFLVKPELNETDGVKNKITEVENVQQGDTLTTTEERKQNGKEKIDNSVLVSKSGLKNGTFICPICDNFKTFFKDEAVVHMAEKHRNSLTDVEVIYIMEARLERKGPNNIRIKCASCDYTSGNLTDIVRHDRILAHRTDGRGIFYSEGIRGVTKHIAGDLVETGNVVPLFQVVSSVVSTSESSEEIYQCWLCNRGKRCSKRKYLKDHIDRTHNGTDMLEINLVMNDMINSMTDIPVQCFQCTLCSEQLDSESELKQHFHNEHSDLLPQLVDQVTTSRNGTGTVCELCHVRCTDDTSLRKHLLLHINKHRTHCPTCGICFDTSEQVASHSLSVHSKPSQMCIICGKIFMKNKDFLRHMRGHGDDSSGIKSKSLCQHCGAEVVKQSFNRHLIRFHSAILTCDCEVCKEQIVAGGKQPVTCNKCNMVFCSTFMLSVHNKKTHPVKRSGRDLHDSAQNDRRCVKCNIIFQNVTQLHNHTCPETIDQSVTSHVDEVDSDNENDFGVKITADMSADVIGENYMQFNGSLDFPYSCRLCQKSFRIKKYLYNHVRRKHSDDESKRFRCKICKMAFDRMNALKRHCKFHIGHRPHQCSVCKRSFKTSSQMKEHMRVHTDSQNPQITCRYCERKFVQNGALMAHIMHHCKLRPFMCPYCKKGFTSSGELRRHMDKYLDDQNDAADTFVCSYCKKQFPNKRFLMKHFYKHGPQNPFQCVMCHRKFMSFNQMYTHKLKTDHFTVEELEEAKADLQTPSGNYKPMEERKELWNKRKLKGDVINLETAVSTSVINKGFELQGAQATEPVFDDQGYVEVEVSNSVDENLAEPGKMALSLYEDNVLKSMFDIDGQENESENTTQQVLVKYENEDQTEYVLETLPEYQIQSNVVLEDGSETVVDMDEGASESFQIETVVENATDIASIVAQNIQSQETGQTQVYQTPDGSFIHVCVIKPSKQ